MQYPIESIPLTPAEREKIERISRAHLVFQAVITEETKECAEQYQAILKVHEAYHWATTAVRIEGLHAAPRDPQGPHVTGPKGTA